MTGERSAARLALRGIALVALLVLAGCGEAPELSGAYDDPGRPGLRYEFRPDLTWTATWESKVPAGIFAQGAARRLEGVYVLRGRRLELTCHQVLERDPMSLGFGPVRSFDGAGELLLRGYDHGFTLEEGALVPAREDHPFGGGRLVPVAGTD
ncbi:MAG: hypothetical protein WEB31_03370 [Chthoniobacterales bacterium]